MWQSALLSTAADRPHGALSSWPCCGYWKTPFAFTSALLHRSASVAFLLFALTRTLLHRSAVPIWPLLTAAHCNAFQCYPMHWFSDRLSSCCPSVAHDCPMAALYRKRNATQPGRNNITTPPRALPPHPRIPLPPPPPPPPQCCLFVRKLCPTACSRRMRSRQPSKMSRQRSRALPNESSQLDPVQQ